MDKECPSVALDIFYPATFRCIPSLAHLNQMPEYPHHHFIQLSKGLLTNYSFESEAFEKVWIYNLQYGSSTGLDMCTPDIDWLKVTCENI